MIGSGARALDTAPADVTRPKVFYATTRQPVLGPGVAYGGRRKHGLDVGSMRAGKTLGSGGDASQAQRLVGGVFRGLQKTIGGGMILVLGD